MGEEQFIVVKKEKSSVPILLAVLALIISIPGALCTLFCAGIGAAAAADSGGSATDVAAIFLTMILPLLASAICFILCFFCKSSKAKLIGIVIMLLAVVTAILNLCTLSFLSMIASVLYAIAGFITIQNHDRI